jgi:hypothetical protein
MTRLRIAFPVALLAALLMVSIGYAQSCCGSGNSSPLGAISSYFGGAGNSLRAPAPQVGTQTYRPVTRQVVASRADRGPAPASPQAYVNPARVQRTAAASVPSCCAGGSTGNQTGRTQYYQNYRQIRPQATLGAISRGCCGGSYGNSRSTAAAAASCCGGSGYTAQAPASGVPSCCSSGSGSYSSYRGAPAPSADVPSCCSVQNGSTAGYKAATTRPVQAVQASATRSNSSPSYWGRIAGSGPFGNPGYFSRSQRLW